MESRWKSRVAGILGNPAVKGAMVNLSVGERGRERNAVDVSLVMRNHREGLGGDLRAFASAGRD
jgi:hypothetical protein